MGCLECGRYWKCSKWEGVWWGALSVASTGSVASGRVSGGVP